MASVSSETLIIFIASLLVAASVAGTMTTGVNRLSDALGDRSIDVSDEIRTDIEIISDPGSNQTYDGSNVTVLVKNTGSGTLAHDPDTIDVLIDGQYRTAVSTTVIEQDTWREGSVIRLTVTGVDLATGDHRVVVDIDGDREVLEFRT
ncbi:Archaellum protein G, flagellin of FlaG/FlaF family [Halanaeroarchaeum sp. HSR-CO]|uniref:flagellar protein G n=1 Tax=Halanaeroarchaeum sp. HSR-CO TaxID=2866382 RepID=UPI00217CD567|nr:flagellar protein G [Halanaeroarchaeum sp. HSR-CO]UWG48019.1 Archaellum protein G, flagellin of FlaG/FlaF family [Halanaeroarchaeum sp. HSR-CO]